MAKQRFPAVERVYSAENHGFLKALAVQECLSANQMKQTAMALHLCYPPPNPALQAAIMIVTAAAVKVIWMTLMSEAVATAPT